MGNVSLAQALRMGRGRKLPKEERNKPASDDVGIAFCSDESARDDLAGDYAEVAVTETIPGPFSF